MKKISIFCPYCNKYTSVSSAEQKVSTGRGNEVVVTSQWKGDEDTWWIGLTHCCDSPVLVCNEGEIIHPSPLPSPTDQRIPDSIREDLEEAKICFSVNAYRACAVIARRAIQSTCIDKGATKDRLCDQIQELFDNRVITKDLKEWADVVRWVGNDAAHAAAGKVDKEDAEDILELAEQFLQVIYVAPAIAKEKRSKIGK